MRVSVFVFFAAVLLSVSAAISFAGANASFEVSATLSHGGKSFAAPSATVQAGMPARFMVSGEDGYDLTLTITDLAPDEIRVVAVLESAYGSMQPTVVVRPDQRATLSVGDLGMELTVSRSGG